jgi:hypothetical protein
MSNADCIQMAATLTGIPAEVSFYPDGSWKVCSQFPGERWEEEPDDDQFTAMFNPNHEILKDSVFKQYYAEDMGPRSRPLLGHVHIKQTLVDIMDHILPEIIARKNNVDISKVHPTEVQIISDTNALIVMNYRMQVLKDDIEHKQNHLKYIKKN